MKATYSHKERSNWTRDLAPYQRSVIWKSLWQMTNTLLPFFALWYLAYVSLSFSIWVALALTIPAAGFLIRTFIIFHDCCHHSFFRSRKANEFVGMFTGLLAFFPYHKWKYEHSVHHAGNGNLERKGTGDIKILTVDEYLALSKYRRLLYRLYRNPLVMFGLGPIFLVLILYRFNRRGAGRKERVNTHATTAVLAAVVSTLCWVLGWKQFLLVEGPILYLSALSGIWLFYVQHQFEDGYFERPENWDYVSAALLGSSFYRLPKVLQWLTGNIGFHHIHHLGPRVPNYHLQQVHEKTPYLQTVPTVGLLGSLRSLRYRVWDEDARKFVGFPRVVRQQSRVEK
jgi:omega-6 fatty acid desaturase (delta-12 desaturase)